MFTKEQISKGIERADASKVYRMLQFLYSCQTASEQAGENTEDSNGVGFTGYDAPFLSSVAAGSQRYGSLTPNRPR